MNREGRPASHFSAKDYPPLFGGTVRVLVPQLARYFASLKRHGTTEPMWDEMLDFKELNEVLGTADMLALGQKYDSD